MKVARLNADHTVPVSLNGRWTWTQVRALMSGGWLDGAKHVVLEVTCHRDSTRWFIITERNHG